MNKQCYCGGEVTSIRFRWCDKCINRMQSNISALFNACLKQHRGAGCSATICICGAGGGGSAACNGLALLRSAIAGSDDYRAEIAEMFGWESAPPRKIKIYDNSKTN